MKKLSIVLALMVAGYLAAAAAAPTVPMASAQVAIDPISGKMAPLPVVVSSTSGTPAPTPTGGPAADATLQNVSGILAGATSTAAPFNTKPLEPTHVVSLTVTGSTSWTNIYLTCTAQPCNFRLFNQGGDTILWWQDQSSSSPAFAGISRTAGTDAIIVPVVPGDYLHIRGSSSNSNAFVQTRY